MHPSSPSLGSWLLTIIDVCCAALSAQGCPSGYSFSGYTTGDDRMAATQLAGGLSIWVNEDTINGLCPFKNSNNTLAYQPTTVRAVAARARAHLPSEEADSN